MNDNTSTLRHAVSRAWPFYKNLPVLGRVLASLIAGLLLFWATASLFSVVAPAGAQTAAPLPAAPTPPTFNGDCVINGPNYGPNSNNCHNTYNYQPRPWQLTGDQWKSFEAVVKSNKDIIAFSILYAPLDPNAQRFAYELQQALVSAGKTEREPIRPLGIDMTGATIIPSGNTFYIKDTAGFNAVKPIIAALADTKIPVIRHVQVEPSLPDSKSILIIVGKNDVDPNSPDLVR